MFTLSSKTNKDLEKLHKKAAKVDKGISETNNNLNKQIQDVLFVGGNDMRNTIITSMTHTKRNPVDRSVKRGNKRHWPSAPGHPPAIDTGELRRSIMFDVRGTELEVGSYAGAPYAKYLEEGTRKMAARPFLEPAVEKNINGILNNIAKIAEDLFLEMEEKR